MTLWFLHKVKRCYEFIPIWILIRNSHFVFSISISTFSYFQKLSSAVPEANFNSSALTPPWFTFFSSKEEEKKQIVTKIKTHVQAFTKFLNLSSASFVFILWLLPLISINNCILKAHKHVQNFKLLDSTTAIIHVTCCCR